MGLEANTVGKLLKVAGPEIGAGFSRVSGLPPLLSAPERSALVELLAARDGFYAFESSLHVFPLRSTAAERGLDSWNAPGLWRDAYDGMADHGLFFAEDVFGGQFCLVPEGVQAFDPETGERELLASGLEQWARLILEDFEVHTGFPLAHQWQSRNGRLEAGKRLVPKIPFVLGGEFAVENLAATDAVTGMSFRAHIALQIRDLPDGAQVRLETV